MKLSALADAVNILRPYYNDPDGYHVGAEHDEIFLYTTDKPLSAEDVAKMRSLGWSQPDAAEDDVYEPNVGWHHHT